MRSGITWLLALTLGACSLPDREDIPGPTALGSGDGGPQVVEPSQREQFGNVCVPSFDQGFVVQEEYPHTSCHWNGWAWDPPGPTQMQLLNDQVGGCILLECATQGSWANGAWLNKLYNYGWWDWRWDNHVEWTIIGSQAKADFYTDECQYGTNYGPQWGPTTILWDYTHGTTAGISALRCYLQ